jgi:hypothetical protein
MANQAINIAKPMNCYPLVGISPKKPGMPLDGGPINKIPVETRKPLPDCLEATVTRGKCGPAEIFDKLPVDLLQPKCGGFPKPQPKCGGIGGEMINKCDPFPFPEGELIEKLPGKLKPKPDFIGGHVIESHARPNFHHHCKCPHGFSGEVFGMPGKPPMPHGVNKLESHARPHVGEPSQIKPLQPFLKY